MIFAAQDRRHPPLFYAARWLRRRKRPLLRAMPSCVTAAGCFRKRASLDRGGRANRQPREQCRTPCLFGGCGSNPAHAKKKERSAPLLFGGRRGIRTPGGFHLNGFQDRRDRPLRHPSVSAASKGSRFLLFSGAFSPVPQWRPPFSELRSQAAPGFRSPPLGGAPLSNSLPKRRSQRCAPRKKSAKVPAPECVPMTFPT